MNSNLFKSVHTPLDPNLPVSKKIEIKYGFEGFEERNNFLHRKFFIFEMDFK
jgi:hypothetical protein